jgi:acyl carrier protein
MDRSNKEEVFNHLKEIMVELFEIPEDDILLGAKLYEDLDIDSIDAVDMIAKLRELTGQRIKPESFKDVRTVEDIIVAIQNL